MLTTRRAIVAATTLLPFGSAFARTQLRDANSLAALIAKHTGARGGARAIDTVAYERVEIDITEKGSTIHGIYQCAKEPAFRIDIYAGAKHVFCEGLDARGPWLWPASDSAPREAVPDARKTGIQGIEFNIYGLHRFAQRGHHLSLDGREMLDGTNYFVIRVMMKDSYETFLFIDPDTWMIARRRDFRAFHPDLDQTKKQVENRYFDFRPVAGVMTSYASDQYDLRARALVQSTRATQIEYRRGYDPAVFARTNKVA